MATLIYNKAKGLWLNGGLDLDTDSIRIALVTSTYVEDADHVFLNEITNELSGGNYVRKTLTGNLVTIENATDLAWFDADNVTWTALQAAAGTPAAAVVYKFVTVDADSPLIAYLEFTAPPIPNGGDWTAVWAAGGLLQIT